MSDKKTGGKTGFWCTECGKTFDGTKRSEAVVWLADHVVSAHENIPSESILNFLDKEVFMDCATAKLKNSVEPAKKMVAQLTEGFMEITKLTNKRYVETAAILREIKALEDADEAAGADIMKRCKVVEGNLQND